MDGWITTKNTRVLPSREYAVRGQRLIDPNAAHRATTLAILYVYPPIVQKKKRVKFSLVDYEHLSLSLKRSLISKEVKFNKMKSVYKRN